MQGYAVLGYKLCAYFDAFARNIVRMITILESRICFIDTFVL